MSMSIFAAAALAVVPPAPPAAFDAAAIQAAEQQFGVAVAGNDIAGISRITSQDWQIIDGDGHIIPRAMFLQVIASGQLKHSALTGSDSKVRVYGDAAIATGHAKSAGEFAGAPFSTDEISTDFWVRTEGGWKCVLTQLTTLKR